MPEETTKMYYGAHEIVNVEDEGDKKRVEIKFATPKKVGKYEEEGMDVGEKFTVPEWELNACASTEACTENEHHTELMNRRANYVVTKTLEMFIDLDVRTEDVPFYMRKLMDSMSMSEENAINKAFGVEDAGDIRFSNWETVVK